jgi:hypothetical protein
MEAAFGGTGTGAPPIAATLWRKLALVNTTARASRKVRA